jgi:hypothetical protein
MTRLTSDEEATLIRPLAPPPRPPPLIDAIARASSFAEGVMQLAENEIVAQVLAPAALALGLIYTSVGGVLLCVLCSR